MTALGFAGLFLAAVSAVLLVAFVVASAVVLFAEWLDERLTRHGYLPEPEPETDPGAALNRIWETTP